MDEIKLVKTGIPGLDQLLKGGLPERSITLISGPPGIGKSNLGMQYIYNGVKEYNEAGIYMNVEYSKAEVKRYCRNFGWDIDPLEKRGMMTILEQSLMQSDDKKSAEALSDTVKKTGAKRLTVDSITLFNYLFDDPKTRRIHLLDFMSLVKAIGLTTVIISEQYGTWPNLQVDSDHFLTDGLVQLFWTTQRETSERCVRVVKMRGQEIDTTIRPFKISGNGVEIYPNEVPFTLKNA
ncbi:MAG: hypothetical protein NTU61_04650 [Candidatus Altiarchaeota archaeon]|nr:hypothetical protein [Candidatus Altiarchaeota archaeon]